MTEQRMKEACKEYARCQQNILSSSAERRMAELDAEAAKAGLRFHMTNEAGYMNPHFIGEPKYELVAISKSKMNTSELRELAVNLGADRKKLYGTSRQSILLIISQLENVNANWKMSFFAGMECHFLAVSKRWVCSLDYPLLVGLKPVKS